MQIKLRRQSGEHYADVEALEIVGDVLAVHMDADNGKWSVTHITTGMHIHGPKGNFEKFETASRYAHEMIAAPVIWFFNSMDEMFMMNDRDNLKAYHEAARLTAELMT